MRSLNNLYCFILLVTGGAGSARKTTSGDDLPVLTVAL